jgi:NAD(P)H dehydrogenase (quinone)
MAETLLVTGASGFIGRRTLEILLDKKAERLVATTRTPEKLADLAKRGVDVREASFDEPGSLTEAFAGVDRLLLLSTNLLDGTNRRLEHQRNAVKAAVAAGVKHVVYKSSSVLYPTAEASIPNDHYWTEIAIAASPVDWTFVRDNLFTDTILWWLPQAIAAGEIVAAAGKRAVNYVTRENVAQSLAAALIGGRGRHIYDSTGPEPVSRAELAAIASELTGRSVRYVSVDPAERRNQLGAAGTPPFFVEATIKFEVETARGYWDIVTPDVKELTGREPTSVREFLTANRAALRSAA